MSEFFTIVLLVIWPSRIWHHIHMHLPISTVLLALKIILLSLFLWKTMFDGPQKTFTVREDANSGKSMRISAYLRRGLSNITFQIESITLIHSFLYGSSISMVDIFELWKCLINLQLLLSHSMTKSSEIFRNHRLFAE